MSSMICFLPSSSPSRAFRAEPRITGISSPGKLYWLNSSRTSSSTRSRSSSSSTMSHLVHENHDAGHLHLAGEENVLAGLGHRAVGRGYNENGAIHLSGAGDHVLDVVGVTRAINVSIVTSIGLVLHVRDRDRNATRPLFGSVVDRVERRGTRRHPARPASW